MQTPAQECGCQFLRVASKKVGEGNGNLSQLTGAKKILTMAELDLCLAVAENTLQGVMQLGSPFDFSFKKLR